MLLTSLTTTTTLLLTSVQGAALALPLQERQWKGKCSIGWNEWRGMIPQGNPVTGPGAAIKVGNAYAFIIGKLLSL